MSKGLPDYLAEIEQASTDAREVIRAAHEAARDLKLLVKDAREVIRQVEKCANKEVGDRLNQAALKGIEEYGPAVQEAIQQAVAHVEKQFTELANLYITGNKNGRGPSLFDEKHREAFFAAAAQNETLDVIRMNSEQGEAVS